MRNVLSRASDKLLALVVPTVEARAEACERDYSWCDGDCPFWWWRRAHHVVCDNGYAFIEYECCGCGC
ncbi:hypothetical protein ABZ816_28745 [Actinosynnema sp. NPDC047251]|uniref:Putative secreted protein n=1 Tax=Saccharothrix espanaensis (strain ATCC 51144 / DSM 44229 / JCM 9112 / NBRC 15066 / NRRL 15764) TaxID=1179773 RepID=K0JS93_SACES|nr:hypothetical protein [Saccharothrix espanaensis]CCH28377.1 putative secreted protein [Saccharothrix espanaensis DSM 44229]